MFFSPLPLQASTPCLRRGRASVRSSTLSCRKRRLPSCWNSTRRRARLLCRLRRNPTREAQHQKEAVVCVVVDGEARTSLFAAEDPDREVVAVEASRTEATSEEVRLTFGDVIIAILLEMLNVMLKYLLLNPNLYCILSFCSSRPSWRLQPSTSRFPASPSLQRRVP